MKKIILFGACLFSTTLLAASYSPSSLEHFRKTGQCYNPTCDLTDTHITVYGYVQPPFDLEGANISGATFAISNNTLTDFNRVTAIHTDFAGHDYSQGAFVNAILINANFSHADLSYTNFAGADVMGADFSYANLYGSQGINLSTASSLCNAILPDGSKGAC